MFDLLTVNSAINQMSKGIDAKLSDKQIVNCIINLRQANSILDANEYNLVYETYRAYCRNKEKHLYNESGFWIRAAEIAYSFDQITHYSDISGYVSIGMKMFIEMMISQMDRLVEEVCTQMWQTINSLVNHLENTKQRVNYGDMYCSATTYFAIILSLVVNQNIDTDMMSVHRNMRKLSHNSEKDVVSWTAFHKYERGITDYCSNTFDDFDGDSWVDKAGELLEKFPSIMSKSTSIPIKCVEFNKLYLSACGVNRMDVDLFSSLEAFVDFMDNLLKEYPDESNFKEEPQKVIQAQSEPKTTPLSIIVQNELLSDEDMIQVKRWKQLYDEGIITEEEYEEIRRKTLRL